MAFAQIAGERCIRRRWLSEAPALTPPVPPPTILGSRNPFMTNRQKLQRLLLPFFAAAILVAASASVPQADSGRYLDDIKTLASPEMEGRGAGTKGLTRAEHLIEKRYKELGLQPAGVNGYAQPFTVITGARLKGDNHFVVQAADGRES